MSQLASNWAPKREPDADRAVCSLLLHAFIKLGWGRAWRARSACSSMSRTTGSAARSWWGWSARLDALFERPPERIVRELLLSPEVQAAALEQRGLLAGDAVDARA
jgi:hypothetical protein